jgi:hypothetical protein
MDTSTPVLVLVCHRQVGVGIAHSLGRLGVPVYGIDGYRGAPAFYSRYCTGRFLWDVHRLAPRDSLRFFSALLRPGLPRGVNAQPRGREDHDGSDEITAVFWAPGYRLPIRRS